jgi:ribosome biogenesis GTPase A
MTLLESIHDPLSSQAIPDGEAGRRDLQWLAPFLRYAMGVYLRRDGEAPKARQLLLSTVESVYGSQHRQAVLESLEDLAQEDGEPEIPQSHVKDLSDEEKLLVAVLLVYVGTVDKDWTGRQHAYLDNLMEALSFFDAAAVRGWLLGTWPRDRYRKMDTPLKKWTSSDRRLPRRLAARVVGFAKQNRRIDVTPDEFRSLWDQVMEEVTDMREAASALGPAFHKEVERSIDALRALKDIRVVVLGEFNVGKSTIINRLLGRPEFMPTDTLPSTSGIIEITEGSDETYHRADATTRDSLKEVPREAFHSGAGNADARSRDGNTEDQPKAHAVERWRVTLPKSILGSEERVALVDTPGLNEDPIRDELAQREAQGAHASVLVIDASQPLTQYERELVEIMAGQIRGMTVVLNKADQASSNEAVSRAKERVLDHLSKYGLTDDQVVAFSATNSVSEGNDSSLATVSELRNSVRQVALRNVTPVRYGQLLDEVERLSRALEQKLNHREGQLSKGVEELREEKEERESEKKRCEIAIDRMTAQVQQQGETAAIFLSTEFEKRWPDIVQDVKDSKENWDTEVNPLFSPKEAARDIAADAEEVLVGRVKMWANEEAKSILEDHLERILHQVKQDLEEVSEYVQRAQGLDSEEIVTQVISSASSEVFGTDDIGMNIKDGFQAALMVVVSAVVGYIIADVVLFYILSIISGFLNPWLLAGAAVAGLAVLAVGGKEAVYRKIKTKIADKLESELTSRSMKEDLRDGLRDKVEETFRDFAMAIRGEASSYLEEAEHQFEKVMDQLEDEEVEMEDVLSDVDELRERRHRLVDLVEAA